MNIFLSPWIAFSNLNYSLDWLVIGEFIMGATKSRMFLFLSPSVALVASLLIGAPLPAAAQSSGALSSKSQLTREMAFSQGLQAAGKAGGTLMPKTAVKDCDEGRRLISGADQRKSVFDVPKSLLDEELKAESKGSVNINGNITVICN